MMSMAPPAASGISKVIGRLGYSSACAAKTRTASATAIAAAPSGDAHDFLQAI
jgi:hypothetical protein